FRSIENEDYFEKKLYLTYLYKDTEIIQSVKSDFNQNKSAYYALFILINSKAKIYHIADNYGQIDLLLTWQYPLRKIVTFIENEEKREVAKVNYPVGKRNITYRNTLTLPEEDVDTLLISTEINNMVTIPNTVKKIFLIGNVKLSNIGNLNEFTEFVNENGVKGFSRNE